MPGNNKRTQKTAQQVYATSFRVLDLESGSSFELLKEVRTNNWNYSPLASSAKEDSRSRDAQSSVQQVQATLFYPAWRLRFSRRFELFEPRGRRCEGKLVRGSPRTKFDCLRPGWPRDRIKRHRNIRRKGRATSPRQWPLSDVLPLSPMLTSQVTHDFQHVTRHANHHRLSLLSVLLASSTHALR